MKVGRVHRLLKMIAILRSGRRFDVEGLVTEMGISRSTVFRDLRLLEQSGFPCRFEQDKQFYSISSSMYLPQIHLNMEEALALLLITRKFLSRQVHPMYQHAVDGALKIESVLPPSVLEHCGDWLDGLTMHWSPTSPADAVSDTFKIIQYALAEHVSLQVQYDSVCDGGEIDVLLDPMRLVFISRGWYLLAKSHQHQEVRTFKMDRVISAILTDSHFTPDAHFSESDYFGKAWCMIPEGRIYSIQLRFSSTVAATVEEVRWHETQHTDRLDDGGLLFEVQVDGLKEITSWIMGYGEHVEILHPPELRERVRRKAEKMIQSAKKLDAGMEVLCEQ